MHTVEGHEEEIRARRVEERSRKSSGGGYRDTGGEGNDRRVKLLDEREYETEKKRHDVTADEEDSD